MNLYRILNRRDVATAFLPAVLVAGWFLGASHAAAAESTPTPIVQTRECVVRGGLPNVLGKLKADGKVAIAYFGGSITEQSGWRNRTTDWLRRQYPAATIAEIDAAIGGTHSKLGVFRLRHDVLSKNPDLIFIEFVRKP